MKAFMKAQLEHRGRRSYWRGPEGEPPIQPAQHSIQRRRRHAHDHERNDKTRESNGGEIE